MARHDCSKHLRKIRKLSATLNWAKCTVCGTERYQSTIRATGHQ